MKISKSVSISLVLILIITSFFGCSSSENIQYTTMGNDDFSFSYPSEWKIEENPIDNNAIFFKATTNKSSQYKSTFDIKYTNEPGITLDSFNFSNCLSYLAKVSYSVGITFSADKHEQIKFGNKDAIVFTFGGYATDHSVDYFINFVPIEDGYYTFTYISINEKCLDEFNTILSTINFK